MRNPHMTFQGRYGAGYLNQMGTDTHMFCPHFKGDMLCRHCDGDARHPIHWSV